MHSVTFHHRLKDKDKSHCFSLLALSNSKHTCIWHIQKSSLPSPIWWHWQRKAGRHSVLDITQTSFSKSKREAHTNTEGRHRGGQTTEKGTDTRTDWDVKTWEKFRGRNRWGAAAAAAARTDERDKWAGRMNGWLHHLLPESETCCHHSDESWEAASDPQWDTRHPSRMVSDSVCVCVFIDINNLQYVHHFFNSWSASSMAVPLCRCSSSWRPHIKTKQASGDHCISITEVADTHKGMWQVHVWLWLLPNRNK